MHLYLKNNRVAMWSEQEIDAPKLKHLEITLTDLEYEKLQQNYETHVENDIIIQKQPPSLTETQKEDRKNLMKKMKEDLKTTKNYKDVLPILNNILTELEK